MFTNEFKKKLNEMLCVFEGISIVYNNDNTILEIFDEYLGKKYSYDSESVDVLKIRNELINSRQEI